MADVLDQHPTAALRTSIANGSSVIGEENAAAICSADPLGLLPAKTQSGWRDSNPRPLRPERSALPSCATPRLKPRQRIAPTRRVAKVDRRQATGAVQITPGLTRDLHHISAWNNRDVGAPKYTNYRTTVQRKRDNHDGVRRRGVRRTPGPRGAV